MQPEVWHYTAEESAWKISEALKGRKKLKSNVHTVAKGHKPRLLRGGTLITANKRIMGD